MISQRKAQKRKLLQFVGCLQTILGGQFKNASSASGLSYKLVIDILHKDLNFKPWKPKSVQELFPEDMDRRLQLVR